MSAFEFFENDTTEALTGILKSAAGDAFRTSHVFLKQKELWKSMGVDDKLRFEEKVVLDKQVSERSERALRKTRVRASTKLFAPSSFGAALRERRPGEPA